MKYILRIFLASCTISCAWAANQQEMYQQIVSAAKSGDPNAIKSIQDAANQGNELALQALKEIGGVAGSQQGGAAPPPSASSKGPSSSQGASAAAKPSAAPVKPKTKDELIDEHIASPKYRYRCAAYAGSMRHMLRPCSIKISTVR
jgi:hypothetical protein